MISRRQFLQLSAFTAAALKSGAQTTSPAVVNTPLGRLSGETRGDVNVFRGIPFAQPPIGPLRFKAPQPPTPWTGLRQATTFAKAAPQAGEDAANQSEDCLYLNLWAPKTAGSYPVFVWVHGGGFTGGRSFDPLFDGTSFAQLGIVVVTVAYRLGVLGFCDMEPILGPAYAGSANNGLKDILASLQWVKSNVAAFYGDPARVTLGGESAGAKLTDVLMGTPAARPFFHQMISESGGAERIATREDALKVGHGFAEAWTSETGKSAAAVQSASAEQLIEVQEKFVRDWPKHFPLRPELDGQFLPELPVKAIDRGSSAGKRLLLGTNRDESALFIGPDPVADPTARDVGNLSIAAFEPIEAAYAKLYPAMPAPLRRIRSLTAEEYLIPSLRVADAHAGAGGETFVYRLDFPGTGRFAGLAFHSYDLRFVWDYFGDAKPSPAAARLAATVHAAWASFLKGEAPELAIWKGYLES
jgi:para-nitrobenzyl esterase